MARGFRTKRRGRRLADLVDRFVDAPTWNESRHIVDTEPDLLDPAAADLLSRRASEARASGNGEAAESFERHARLLRRCVDIGTAAAFGERRAEAMFRQTDEFTELLQSALSATAELAYAATDVALERATTAWTMVNEYPNIDNAPAEISLARNAGMATVLLHRFQIEGDIGDLDVAIEVFRGAVTAAGEEHPLYQGLHNDLAVALLRRYERVGRPSDLDEAIELLAVSAHDEEPGRAGRLANLGGALTLRYHRDGDLATLETAIHLLDDSVEATALDSPNRPSRLTSGANAVSARFAHTLRSEDLDYSIDLYRETLQLTPPDDVMRPLHLANAGSALLDRYSRAGHVDDLDEGLDLLTRAVSDTPTSSPDRPRHLTQLSRALLERYSLANQATDLDAAVERAAEAVRAAAVGSARRADYLASLARAHRTRADATLAPTDTDQATEAFRASCNHGLTAGVASCLDTAMEWGEWAVTLEHWPQAAEAYGFALAALHRLVAVHGGRGSAERWIARASQLPTRIGFAVAKAGDLEGAVLGFERSRALLLSQTLQEIEADLERLVSTGEAALADTYRTAARRVASMTDVLDVPDPGAMQFADLAQLRTARRELVEATDGIRGVEGFERFLTLLSWEDVTLAASAGALVYLAYDWQGGVALMVHERHGVSPVWLPDLSTGSVLVHTLHAIGLFRADLDEETKGSWWAELTDWMWSAVMGPLLDGSPDSPHLRLIAGGTLALMPLHAASTPNTAAGPRYAIDERTISYVPNARAALSTRRSAGTTSLESVLCVAGPEPSSFDPLEHVDWEADAVRALFPRSRLIAGSDATVEEVRSAIAGFDVLHFACHAVAETSQPLNSGLNLAGDERYRLRDLASADLHRVGLVVLSACETAVPGDDLPDEVVSLASAFIQAGASGIVASQWQVFDVETMVLMSRFYQNWRLGPMDPASALREAQRWLRDATNETLHALYPDIPDFMPPVGLDRKRWGSQRPADHPEAWAGFIYVGS